MANVFPPAVQRQAWQEARRKLHNVAFGNYLIGQAELLLSEPIPEVPAHFFMGFVRNGNRSDYETPYFLRRSYLETLALAESFEYQGRFLDRIVDYIVEILNERPWTVPAHVIWGWNDKYTDPLPDLARDQLDLFAAFTGSLLAEVYNLLATELTAISPNLVQRLLRELKNRIVDAIEFDVHLQWWTEGYNNWTPWVATNCLSVVLTTLNDDPERQDRLIQMLTGYVDKFIARYPEDAACDEGPTYWTVSPVAMLMFLEQLYQARGVDSYFKQDKIRKMGEYIVDSHLGAGNFAPFADASPLARISPEMCWLYGIRTDSDKLKDFALLSLQNYDQNYILYPGLRGNNYPLLRSLTYIFTVPNLLPELWANQAKTAPAEPKDSFTTTYYPHTMLFFAKSKRLSLAAKGGTNGENHNHNDVGQFIIAVDGQPLIVDLGSTEYTANTFNEHRYENWVINSYGHNVAMFNQKLQHEGGDFAAKIVSCEQSEQLFTFVLDLRGAYSADAGVREYLRKIVFDATTETIEVTDSWQLDSSNNQIVVPLYAPGKVVVKDNSVLVSCLDKNLQLTVLSNAEITTETADFGTDNKIRKNWEQGMTRIALTCNCAASGEIGLKFNVSN